MNNYFRRGDGLVRARKTPNTFDRCFRSETLQNRLEALFELIKTIRDQLQEKSFFIFISAHSQRTARPLNTFENQPMIR